MKCTLCEMIYSRRRPLGRCTIGVSHVLWMGEREEVAEEGGTGQWPSQIPCDTLFELKAIKLCDKIIFTFSTKFAYDANQPSSPAHTHWHRGTIDTHCPLRRLQVKISQTKQKKSERFSRYERSGRVFNYSPTDRGRLKATVQLPRRRWPNKQTCWELINLTPECNPRVFFPLFSYLRLFCLCQSIPFLLNIMTCAGTETKRIGFDFASALDSA